jgi:exopolysaccharide biosynthesis polyprenyl glycosylphosphotransferase
MRLTRYGGVRVIRRHATAFAATLMVADGLLAASLFVAVSIVRFGNDNWQAAWAATGADWPFAAAWYAVIWVCGLWLAGLYRFRAWSLRGEIADIGRAAVLLAVVVFSALFVLKLPTVSRLFLIELFAVQIALAVVWRWFVRLALGRVRSRNQNAGFVLVVGTDVAATSFADRIERHRELGLRVVGHLSWREDEPAAELSRPVLGTVADIEDIFATMVVDEVAACPSPTQIGLLEPVAALCQEAGTVVRVPLEPIWVMLPGGRVDTFDGIQVLSLAYGPERALGLLAKRTFDLVAASLALVVLAPVLLAIAVCIRIVDGPPALFRQVRVGRHGRQFRVAKFRTMVLDAEEQLDALAELNEIKGHAFKVTDDPRLSRTGRFLRKSSLDELPQFWNVVRGEMSIVGPRPPLPREVAGYDLWHRRRLSMKPGITGLWQVSGRHDEDFDRWVELDLTYIDRWSLWLDFKIMLRTVPAMLQGR